MHITERIVERNWGHAESVWFSHVTLQNREGTFSNSGHFMSICHPMFLNTTCVQEEWLAWQGSVCKTFGILKELQEKNLVRRVVLPKKKKNYAKLRTSRTLTVPLRASNQLFSPKIHLSAYSNPELKRHRGDQKKHKTLHSGMWVSCSKDTSDAQALQYFSSPHCDFEHLPEYNNLLHLKNMTALQRQANSVGPCPAKSRSSWNSLAASEQQHT